MNPVRFLACVLTLLAVVQWLSAPLFPEPDGVRFAWTPGESTFGYYVYVGTNFGRLPATNATKIIIIPFNEAGIAGEPMALSTNAIMYEVWLREAAMLGEPWIKTIKLGEWWYERTNGSRFFQVVAERKLP